VFFPQETFHAACVLREDAVKGQLEQDAVEGEAPDLRK
jgi:hypothetical protein